MRHLSLILLASLATIACERDLPTSHHSPTPQGAPAVVTSADEVPSRASPSAEATPQNTPIPRPVVRNPTPPDDDPIHALADPHPADFYRYATELARQGRFTDAARAFSRAADDGHLQTALTRYDAAAMLALAHDTDAAFAQLEVAVGAGFHAFSRLDRDPRLASLRADPRWAERRAALSHPDVDTEPTLLAGTYTHAPFRSPEVVVICPNGTFQSHFQGSSHREGHWSIEEGALMTYTTYICNKGFDSPLKPHQIALDDDWRCEDALTPLSWPLWRTEDFDDRLAEAQHTTSSDDPEAHVDAEADIDPEAFDRFFPFAKDHAHPFCSGGQSLRDHYPTGEHLVGALRFGSDTPSK